MAERLMHVPHVQEVEILNLRPAKPCIALQTVCHWVRK